MPLSWKFVIQRTLQAEVCIEGISQGLLEKGLMVFVGLGGGDDEHYEDFQKRTQKAVDKILGLRIFNDAEGKMNLSVKDIQGGVYLVSQFTLWGDCQKGFRPSFSKSASSSLAQREYDLFVELFKKQAGDLKVLTGIFAADMKVSFLNDGPVTLIYEI